MIPIYYGFDEREEIGAHTFCSSIIHNASRPIALIPLHLKHFKSFYSSGHRDGTNAFIYTRFLIPFLQDFSGWAIFADGADMICLGDVAELYAQRDHYKAVQVVQHEYKTKHPRKYVGTKMEAQNEDYPKKNQSSVMLINCGHFAWRQMTPEKIEGMTGRELHTFSFIPPDRLGDLPEEWNWLCDEFGENPDAKLLHWTAGIPGFKHYANAPMAGEWRKAAANVTHAID